MLHILLFILKIIGWILLAILGILVLFLCVVLFTPLKYELSGKCDGELSSLNVKVKFSYFFRLISGVVQYTDETIIWKLRIAWKKAGSEEAKAAAKSDVKEAAEEIAETMVESTTVPETSSVKPETTVRAEDKVRTERVVDTEETAKTEPSVNVTKQKTETASEAQDGFFEKIAYKFEQLCDKIEEISKKKDCIMDFLTNEIHKAALVKVLSEVKRLIIRMKPRQLQGSVTFGFEDPALTGKVLAGLSVLYPYFSENLEIDPRFAEKLLMGKIDIKGSIAIRIFASLGVRLLFNKNIRTTIQHAKKFKLS